MNRIHAAALVLVGVALGCGAAAIVPIATSQAQSLQGKWDCFVVDRLPGLDAARSWEGAANIKEGFDRAAPNTATGTMIAVTPSSGRASVACVKH
jgi:hypothetical protein